MLDDLLKALSKIAPVVGTAVGGPVGGAIGMGIGVLAKAITGKETNEDVIAALSADPKMLAEFQIKVQELANDITKAYLADTQNARQHTVELAKAGSPIAYGAVLISVLLIIGYFGCVYLLFFQNSVKITDNMKDVMIFMLGALQIGFGQVCNYWLGSSKGSSEKNDVLLAALRK
jgi:hypothetical protein